MSSQRLARLASDPRLRDQPTPCVLVDGAAVRRNVQAALHLIGHPGRWRPHTKTARSPWAIARLRDVGVTRFKVATPTDLRGLLDLAVDDVLVAYPAVGPRTAAITKLAESHPATRVSVLVDSVASASELTGDGLGAFIDVDTGGRRTGVPVADHERLLDIAATLHERGVDIRGLHAYDGHLASLPPTERGPAVAAGVAAVLDAADHLETAGHDLQEIVVGGSHTFVPALEEARDGRWWDRLTVGPGTLVFHDLRSIADLERHGFEVAVAVLSRVVSAPAAEVVTLDAGLTSLQVDAGAPHAEVAGFPGLTVGTPAQEHLPLEVAGTHRPAVGDIVALVPRHIDTTVVQFDRMIVVEAGGAIRRERLFGRWDEPW